MNKHIVKYAPKRELEKPIPATEEWKKAYRLMKVKYNYIYLYLLPLETPRESTKK